jgi:hypothetical protein
VEFAKSPFYSWLDHARIRRLVHEVGALPPGGRLVLLKGLVPGLVDTIGLEETEAFLGELATKARRYGEAERHPGEGRFRRETPGEPLGGPTPDGHRHAGESRDPDRPGGRAAERVREAAMWLRDVDAAAARCYRAEAEALAEAYIAAGILPGAAALAAWETLARLRGLVSAAPAPKSPEPHGPAAS